VGLSSKSYSIEVQQEGEEKKEKNKCKGVTGAYSKQLTFQDYYDCLDTLRSHSVVQYTIQSRDHVIRTMKTKKIAFSSFDDKRFYTCAIHTVPHGSIYAYKDRCVFCDGTLTLK
jgi:hypothetical protein